MKPKKRQPVMTRPACKLLLAYAECEEAVSTMKEWSDDATERFPTLRKHGFQPSDNATVGMFLDDLRRRALKEASCGHEPKHK